MTPEENRHVELSAIRVAAYNHLFGSSPVAGYTATQLRAGDDDPFLIDVLIYELPIDNWDEPAYIAVTNGMSDHQMAEGDDPEQLRRREIIQYLARHTEGHARRLRDMAWLPLHDGFLLDTHHTLPWNWAAVEGTPWKNALFLQPLLRSHQELTWKVEGETAAFLWHIPVSDEERQFILDEGVDAFIDIMDEAELSFVFDEEEREVLVVEVEEDE
jgi:hypothetical protein